MKNPNPTTAKRQLNAFYVRQGLQGRDRHRAVRADMKRVREYAKPEDFADCQRFGLGFNAMFLFCDTREGVGYWAARSQRGGK